MTIDATSDWCVNRLALASRSGRRGVAKHEPVDSTCRGERNDTPDVFSLARARESACVDVIESGGIDKCLALLVHPDHLLPRTSGRIETCDAGSPRRMKSLTSGRRPRRTEIPAHPPKKKPTRLTPDELLFGYSGIRGLF